MPPRAAVTAERRDGAAWSVTVEDQLSGERRSVRARALVGAAGPRGADVVGRVAGSSSSRGVRLVEGSHVIVPKFRRGEHACLVQSHDGRVTFINPYKGDKALTGTTDIP